MGHSYANLLACTLCIFTRSGGKIYNAFHGWQCAALRLKIVTRHREVSSQKLRESVSSDTLHGRACA